MRFRPPRSKRPTQASAAPAARAPAVDWATLNAPRAIELIASTSDRSLLLDYQAQELARTRPRKTVLSALADVLD